MGKMKEKWAEEQQRLPPLSACRMCGAPVVDNYCTACDTQQREYKHAG